MEIFFLVSMRKTTIDNVIEGPMKLNEQVEELQDPSKGDPLPP